MINLSLNLFLVKFWFAVQLSSLMTQFALPKNLKVQLKTHLKQPLFEKISKNCAINLYQFH